MLNELGGKVVDPFPVNVPLDHAQSVASARHVANAHTGAYPALQRVAGQVARLEGFPLSPPPSLPSLPFRIHIHTHASQTDSQKRRHLLRAGLSHPFARRTPHPCTLICCFGPKIEPQDERRQEADRRGLRADWELPRGASGNNVEIDLILNY